MKSPKYRILTLSCKFLQKMIVYIKQYAFHTTLPKRATFNIRFPMKISNFETSTLLCKFMQKSLRLKNYIWKVEDSTTKRLVQWISIMEEIQKNQKLKIPILNSLVWEFRSNVMRRERWQVCPESTHLTTLTSIHHQGTERGQPMLE